MELAIRHYLPGRMRLHVPELCRTPSLADALAAWLRGLAGVKTARLNYDCACLIVEYEAAREGFFRALLARLKVSTIKEIAGLIAPGAGPAVEAARSPAGALKSPARQSNIKN